MQTQRCCECHNNIQRYASSGSSTTSVLSALSASSIFFVLPSLVDIHSAIMVFVACPCPSLLLPPGLVQGRCPAFFPEFPWSQVPNPEKEQQQRWDWATHLPTEKFWPKQKTRVMRINTKVPRETIRKNKVSPVGFLSLSVKTLIHQSPFLCPIFPVQSLQLPAPVPRNCPGWIWNRGRPGNAQRCF